MSFNSVLIIDDEPAARFIIKNYLAEIDPDLIPNEAGSVADAVKMTIEKKPQLVFLDIKLRNQTGFDYLDQIPDIDFFIIFTTSHEDFAIDAIKRDALDYLVKPFTKEQFKNAYLKAARRKNSEDLGQKITELEDTVVQKEEQSLKIKTSRKIYFKKPNEVIRAESDSNYTFFYFANGEKALVSKPLKSFEEVLTQHGFIRVHQTHMINLGFVDCLDNENQMIILKDQTQIPVSRSRKKELFEILGL